MEKQISMKCRMLNMVLFLCVQAALSACSHTNLSAEKDTLTALADKVWDFSQQHPDGFTLDIHSMTEPTEGIAVSYAATQNSHSRSELNNVIRHALTHNGYVGGWYNPDDGQYYFDSTRLFPQNELTSAIHFGKENGQTAVFSLSTATNIPVDGKVAEIAERGTLLVGTTGDYRPLSFCESGDGSYWGFGIEMAQEIARRLGVKANFVKTSWPTLTNDVLAEPQTFDMAIGGITITDARKETMLMSDGYLANGKTILCRKTDCNRFTSLSDLDKPEVRVMVNPGGLNERFARENLTHATLLVHQQNEEIPSLVAEGKADVMITEITEAPYYVKADLRLAAPLLDKPFTHGEIGVLMKKGQDDLCHFVNAIIQQMKDDGSLSRLHEKYGLVYAYDKKEPVQFVPKAPDYSNPAMWFSAENDTQGTGADVFYVISTWEFDWTNDDGHPCHYADVWNPKHRGHMAIEQRKVAEYMAQGNNFYAPYYRHITLNSWATLNEDTIARRFQLSMGDVKQAFDHFLSKRNKNRPLVIAGFSQGAKAVVELLKYMDDETYEHLAAAYVMGYKVTPEDVKQSAHIKAAKGANDTGVTICYNSVKDVKYVKPIISDSNIFCINPVNWKTDGTPAILHDSITVTIVPEEHVLTLTGYSGSEYKPILGILNVGDLHGCEPWLYSDCLRTNIALRINEWRKKNQ